jgi:hypothetical protein
MHKCETFQLKDKRGKWVKNPKSNEMLVTTKLHNRKYRQVIIIKSKMKFKDTSENAKRKKAAATFQYQRKKRFQGLKHTG